MQIAKKRVLLLGGSGLVGSRILTLLNRKISINAPKRNDLNLLSKDQIERFDYEPYDFIIYSAGVTNWLIAEEKKKMAKELNSLAVKRIVNKLKDTNKTFIYFSSDSVFDGKKNDRPYRENDKINPINYYGYTKALGEDYALMNNKNLVIRLNSVYSPHHAIKIDFARRLINDLKTNGQCIGITDQYFNPSYADEIINVLLKVLNHPVNGVLHIGARDMISNLEFTQMVARKFGYKKSQVKGVPFHIFFNDIKKAQYQWLDTTKAQGMFGNLVKSNLENINSFYKSI